MWLSQLNPMFQLSHFFVYLILFSFHHRAEPAQPDFFPTEYRAKIGKTRPRVAPSPHFKNAAFARILD